jgi:hypothetical protein
MTGWLKNVEQLVEWEMTEEIEVRRENRPGVTLSSTDLRWSDLRSNPDCRNKNLATKCLSYATPKINLKTWQIVTEFNCQTKLVAYNY